MGLKYFIEESNFIDEVLNEFNSAAPATQTQNQYKEKPWSAKKSEILQIWRNTRPDTPIILEPITEKPEGSNKTNYGEDGIRITGSFNFIKSVLSRIKEILTFENPETRLRLVLRAVDISKRVRPDKNSYAFYVNLERRGKGKSAPSQIVSPQTQTP